MEPERERHYLQLAQERPDMLCSEVPAELLEEAAHYDEPTEFLEEFFGTGHSLWFRQKHGQRFRLSRERLNNAVIVLWLRACRLHTNQLMGLQDPDLEKPFFSDEGLYE
jgi:hypothetical protein